MVFEWGSKFAKNVHCVSAHLTQRTQMKIHRCLLYTPLNASVAARNSRITPSIKVSSSEATNCIEKFRQGEINVMVATAVIEGLYQMSSMHFAMNVYFLLLF